MIGDETLNIAIIGGGIAGLATASVLRKKHHVTIYERNTEDTREAGAAVSIGPNGTKMAKGLGLTKEAVKGVSCKGFKTFNKSGTLLSESKFDFENSFGSDYWLVHRQDLKDALYKLVINNEGGNPSRICYMSEVTGVETGSGRILFANGRMIQVDLIIGADGLHSKVRSAVIKSGHPLSVLANLSIYRFTLLNSEVREALRADYADKLNFDNDAFLTMFVAADGSNRNVVIYPCRKLERVNFAFAVPESLLRERTEDSWTLEGKVEEIAQHFDDFPPELKAIMSKVQSVKLYQLRDQDPLPSYAKGRTVLIGDAAHPMVPYQGQGANQALEDAEGMSFFLDSAVTRETVTDVLEKWQSIRRPRASQIQLNSRVSGRNTDPETIMKNMKFNWTYDRIRNALEQQVHYK